MSYVVSKVSELPASVTNLDATDIVMVAVVDGTSPTGFKTVQMTGQQIIDGVGSTPASTGYNTASSQYKKTGISAVIPDGTNLNLLTLLDAGDVIASGTTSYYDLEFRASISMDLNGTTGTANINVVGTDYLMTFNTDGYTTCQNWVLANQAAINADGVYAYAYITGSGVGGDDGAIMFTSIDTTKLDTISFTNLTGDISATFFNVFTGTPNVSSYDHFIVPYVSTPIDTQRLLHTMRLNFYVQTGAVQTYSLSLIRFVEGTVIGSPIKVYRDVDEAGEQFIFETYTNNGGDPFATGGFYFLLSNNSGQSATIDTELGVLVSTIFQQPTIFP